MELSKYHEGQIIARTHGVKQASEIRHFLRDNPPERARGGVVVLGENTVIATSVHGRLRPGWELTPPARAKLYPTH